MKEFVHDFEIMTSGHVFKGKQMQMGANKCRKHGLSTKLVCLSGSLAFCKTAICFSFLHVFLNSWKLFGS